MLGMLSIARPPPHGERDDASDTVRSNRRLDDCARTARGGVLEQRQAHSDASGNRGASEDESKAPEEAGAPASEVSASLTQIRDISAQVAQAVGSDKAKAKELNEQIEPVWQSIEGTVKANDSDAYITFEDSFAELARQSTTATPPRRNKPRPPLRRP